MTDINNFSIHEASTLYQQQLLSPVEVTQACLERISRLDDRLNCFITLTPEMALEQARQAEDEIKRGECRGPLHGIPIALKDLYETRGIRTTAGSRLLGDYVPAEDALLVQRLFSHGVVLLGKLNMHEIALGVTNENPHYGACRNPFDQSRISGGSSGGSAAAVAAGLCLASLGSDTGGSIRIPASLCGVVGFKPTFGRLSLRGVIPLSWNLDHAGFLTRTVRDAATLLQFLAGYDSEDPVCANQPVDDYLASLDAGVKGWRIGMLEGDSISAADSGILQAVSAAAQVFVSLGASVETINGDFLLPAARANSTIVISDAAATYRQYLASAPHQFGADVLTRLQHGAACPLADYILARRTQAVTLRQLEQLFTRFDLLLLPATPLVAPKLGAADAIERARQLTRFTAPFNLTGLPAITLPCGFITEGEAKLPVGLQIVAPAWQEKRLLRAAQAYEQARGWTMTVISPLFET